MERSFSGIELESWSMLSTADVVKIANTFCVKFRHNWNIFNLNYYLGLYKLIVKIIMSKIKLIY